MGAVYSGDRMEDEEADGVLLHKLPRDSVGVRACAPIRATFAELRSRAIEAGCGQVTRDELFAALVAQADIADDAALKESVERWRSLRAEEPPAESPADD